MDIRWLDLDQIRADDWPALERMLDAAERERAGRFRFERDRNMYVAAHALVRAMLSGYTGQPPSDWRFIANSHGKPGLSMTSGMASLQFNISHTRGLVAAAVTVGNDVGLDVETLEHGRLTMDMASRFFAAAEVRYLRQLPTERQQDAMFAFWTLKESYIKAVGLGMSIPLDAFSFALDPLAISFSSRQPDCPSNWLFRRFSPSERHAMALALRHREPDRVGIHARPVPVAAVLALSDQTKGPGNISRR